nr:MAG TPA: hypothetical protein [Caudoviricetes sp.]
MCAPLGKGAYLPPYSATLITDSRYTLNIFKFIPIIISFIAFQNLS